MTEKKAWIVPQLIVLARGRPEEAVLAICKFRQVSESGPGRGGTCAQNGRVDCMDLGLS